MNTEAQAGTDFEIPETFDYNESDLERPRDQLRVTEKAEIFKGVVTKLSRSIGRNKKSPEKSNNNLQLEVRLAALDEAGNKFGSITNWVTIPVPNPKVSGHKPYATGKERDMQFLRAREFIRSVMGDDALPPFPKKKEDGTYFLPDTGDAVTQQGYQARVKEIDDKTISVLQKWWKECPNAEAANAVLYFATKQKDGSPYVNVAFTRHDDGGKTVVTEGFTS